MTSYPEPPELPEVVLHPRQPGLGTSFKDFSPKFLGPVQRNPFGEIVEESAPEVEAEDPKASDATVSANSSDQDASGNSKPTATDQTNPETQPPKQPSPSIPSLPSTIPATAEKEATTTGS